MKDKNKILIINLTRMGDIIQTSALINSLQKKYINSKIDFLCTKSFQKILDYMENINQVFTIEDEKLINTNDENFLANYKNLNAMIQQLNNKNYDLLINPVVSIQSSIISYLIKADKKMGMVFTKEREYKNTSDWSAYHLANEHNLGDHSFNLVDIFSGIGGVKSSEDDFKLIPTVKAKLDAKNFLLKFNPENKKNLGFHIGASESNKSWETEKFKNVILTLLKQTDYKIILFGGYKEIALKEFFLDISHQNFTILIGKTNIEQLIAYINYIDLMVSNDTGPIHIAAAMKKPILNISLGPVSHWETAPYKDNSVALQARIECHPCKFTYNCPHWNCHKYIKEEDVLKGIYAILNNKMSSLCDTEKVHFWITNRDIFGCHHAVPVVKRSINFKEFIFEIKRLIWGMTLINDLENGRDYIEDYLKYLQNYYFLKNFDFHKIISDAERFLYKIDSYTKLVDEISRISPHSQEEINKIKEIWGRASIIFNDLKSTMRLDKNFRDFFAFTEFKSLNCDDNDFVKQTKCNLKIYCDLYDQIRIFTNILRRFNETNS